MEASWSPAYEQAAPAQRLNPIKSRGGSEGRGGRSSSVGEKRGAEAMLHADEIAQRFELFIADARDALDILDGLEGTVGLAIGDDLGSGGFPDAR